MRQDFLNSKEMSAFFYFNYIWFCFINSKYEYEQKYDYKKGGNSVHYLFLPGH